MSPRSFGRGRVRLGRHFRRHPQILRAALDEGPIAEALAIIQNDGEAHVTSVPRSKALSKGRPLIAIVDDEEPVRRALRRLIRSAGLEVDTFPGGAEFIQSLPRRTPDCVVLDLHMPGVSGFDVQRHLAQLAHPIPVVAITGRDSDEVRERAAAAGATAYLLKPVSAHTLLEALALAITGARDY